MPPAEFFEFHLEGGKVGRIHPPRDLPAKYHISHFFREVPKIIDSNVPWGWGYVSSQKNAHKLFVHIPTKKKHLEEKSKVEASNPEESEEMPPARSSWCLL